MLVVIKILQAFFVFFIFKPLKAILRFVFNNLIVKIYGYFLVVKKRFGWEHKKEKFIHFIFSQKLVHVIVILVTCFLIFFNLIPRIQANAMNDTAKDTMLSKLVNQEFSDTDEELIHDTFDAQSANNNLDEDYLNNLTNLKAQPKVVINSSEEEAEVSDSENIPAPILAPENIKPRLKIEEYAVGQGDTVSTIAQKYGLNVNTILWENNLSAYSIIRPGDILAILPINGVSYKVKSGETLGAIANKFNVKIEDIMKANNLISGNNVQIGQKIVVPGATKLAGSAPRSKSYSGLSIIENIVKSPGAVPIAGNKMNWPTSGHIITQYFSWRHKGLDIANKKGTPIYAADAGTVEYSGWATGYGNAVVINHGGGKKTRYGHMSKIYVKKGQTVGKGENIGAMGSTGWSTGPHLHFEVIINGGRYNPLSYVK